MSTKTAAQRSLFEDEHLTAEQEEALDRYHEAAEGRAARDEGMESVVANAGEEWQRRARIVVLGVAHQMPGGFTTDDVWRAGLEKPHDPRALGPVMKGLQGEGLISPTNEIRNSGRREAHAGPKRIWRRA